MPQLPRSEWYDLTRDMNWDFTYVTDEQVFPEEMSESYGVPKEAWWTWDEPYKITYPEYVHVQAGKDASVYAVNSVVNRSKLYEGLDPGWKSAILAHYGAIAVAEYTAAMGEARMGRFGRAAAWRNMAMYGTLDETRHGQIQTYFPYTLLAKEPKADWAHKAYHTNEWGIIASRSLFDDMFAGNDAVSTAIQLTFCFETGFTNLQFLGMAADAMGVGDIEFSSLISSIQTDEARHAQQGEPTMKILIENGQKDVAQKLIDHMFWRSWKIFSLLTGLSMDYYTPLENRRHSFKEFMDEWINKQFVDQFRDFGLEKPWYWNDHYLKENNWLHRVVEPGCRCLADGARLARGQVPGLEQLVRQVLGRHHRERPLGQHPDDLPGDTADGVQHLPCAGVHPGRLRRRLLGQPGPADPRLQRSALHVLLGAVQVDLRDQPAAFPGPSRRRRPVPRRNDPAA